MNPFDYFKEIYCINLPDDIERKQSIDKRFEEVSINHRIKYISAIRTPHEWRSNNYQFPGEYGVVRSQLKAMVNGLRSNGHIVIFEDDIQFELNSLTRLGAALKELPEDWDVLYFAGRPLEKLNRYSDNLCKTNKFTSAMSYAINRKALDKIAMWFTDRMTLPFPHACCDNMLNDFLLNGGNGYCIYPQICSHVSGWSTLRQGYRNYENDINTDWERYAP